MLESNNNNTTFLYKTEKQVKTKSTHNPGGQWAYQTIKKC